MAISDDIKMYESLIHKGEALKRLMNNSDFKELFLDDLLIKSLKTDSIRLSNTISTDGFNSIARNISALGFLADYLETITKNAKDAEYSLKEAKNYQAEQERLEAEGL